MGLIRFILIACLIWLLFRMIKKIRQQVQDRQKHYRRRQAVTRKQMVQCASCSIYVPIDDALCKGEYYFCCTDHMDIEVKKN